MFAMNEFKMPVEPAVPCQAFLKVEWPLTLEYKEEDGNTYSYFSTGRKGYNNVLENKMPCAEYKRVEIGIDKRIWLRLDGKINVH